MTYEDCKPCKCGCEVINKQTIKTDHATDLEKNTDQEAATCSNCGLTGPYSDTTDEAVSAWNELE